MWREEGFDKKKIQKALLHFRASVSFCGNRRVVAEKKEEGGGLGLSVCPKATCRGGGGRGGILPGPIGKLRTMAEERRDTDQQVVAN